MLCDVVM